MNSVKNMNKAESLCKKYGKCYENYCLSSRECEFYNLKKRVQKIEDYLIKERNKELEWAVAQFRYMKKDNEQRRALEIIEKELGLKKTSLRCKSVKNG